VRLGSLCTGYGGLDMAVEHHYGATLAWHAEVDKHCSQVLAHHWPGVPNLGDLTQIDWDRVDPVDILCAGFPCQPFSHAGKREGANDDRAIFAYIGDGISVLRQRRRQPRIVVLENVAGLLTLGGPGVIGTLTGLGYDLRWGLVRASDAGAPHRRARWFCIARSTDPGGQRHGSRQVDRVVGHLDGEDWRPRGQLVDRGSEAATDADERGFQGVRPERGLATATLEPCTTHRFGAYGPAIERWERTIGRPAPDPTDDRGLRPEFVSWMMGLPEGHVCDLGLSRTAELKMLGNGVCPQQAALALELLDER